MGERIGIGDGGATLARCVGGIRDDWGEDGDFVSDYRMGGVRGGEQLRGNVG